ncbi:hypothetical protein RGQ29_018651 [Quercus rubra]|uniref:Uncharacterized protein n=1 Tax=Quercus rubra TaxID=3512 RepID=A0AAN7FQQ0_QUERU|nr:hypothetical protein RGQ29_018651 [Quercus rubra]
MMFARCFSKQQWLIQIFPAKHPWHLLVKRAPFLSSQKIKYTCFGNVRLCYMFTFQLKYYDFQACERFGAIFNMARLLLDDFRN